MIGIICAIREEVDAMLSHMEDMQEKKLFTIDVYEGKIANKEVVVAFSGVGKVYAAITTTLLATQYNVSCIINVGVAGGLLQTQNVGDIVIAKDVIQHDFDTSALDGEEGIGKVSKCSRELANQFAAIVEENDVTAWLGDVASGDCFVALHNHFDRIVKTFPNCVCCEMEAGAIAQTCEQFKVPCLIVRSLSDVAAKQDNGNDFLTFAKKASALAGDICAKLIAKI